MEQKEYIALLWTYSGDRYYMRADKNETFADFKKRIYKDFDYPKWIAEFYEVTPKH